MTFHTRINRLLARAWERGVLPEPPLRSLLSADVPGGERVEEPLHVLVRSLEEEAALNPLGRAMAYGQLSKIVRNRRRAERLWRKHPEILDWPLEPPIVVLGHMRSGTTRIQRLLACDPRLSHTRFFETFGPAPGPLRRSQAWAALTALHAFNPEIARVHPTSATAADEEFGLLSQSFFGAQIEAQWRVPSFARYWDRADRRPVYQEFRRLLQTIAWSRRERRPWVLKVPQFMRDLDLVLECFPGARLICLQRDLASVVASSASLVWNQMRVQSDGADKNWIGAEWLRKTVRRERNSASVRAANPHVPQLDVAFDDMNGDWLGEMRRIYSFLGLELTPAVERRMRAYLSRAERSGFRGHRYTLEEFGLSRGQVEKAFGGAERAPIYARS